MTIRFFTALLLAASLCPAEISGPVIGYVPVRDTLRRITGIPGAAYLDDPILLDSFPAAVSSELAYIVVLADDGSEAQFHSLPSGHASGSIRLSQPAGRVILSTLSTSALAVSRDGEWMEIITGLPSRPVLSKAMPVPPGQMPRAVSDDGSAVALTEEERVLTIVSKGTSQALTTAGHLSDVRFLAGTHSLLYTDSAGAQAGLISQSESTVIAGASDGLSRPQSAAIAGRNDRFLLVADAGTNVLLVRDRTGMTTPATPLFCTPQHLIRLSESVLRMECADEKAVRLIHVTEQGVRMLFVPEAID